MQGADPSKEDTMQINTNLAAMNAQRNLGASQSNLNQSLERLSSGLRINSAKDDAAGLVISEGLRSQIGGLKQATRNAQDGISVTQTAEGALNEVQNMLQRVRDLAVQAANDSNDVNARSAITSEVTALREEISRIGASTNFNGTNLLDGSASTLKFQVGADGDATSAIAVNLTSADLSAVTAALQGTGTTFAVDTPTAVTGDLSFTDGSVSSTVTLGAANTYKTVQDVADALNGDSGFKANFTASVDKDNQLLVQSKSGDAVAVTAPGTGVGAGTASVGGLDFSSHDGAQAALGVIDGQIAAISSARGELGAVQNRFESTIANLGVSVENLSASESRIRDADMAMEMTEYSRNQVLQQAGTAMLAQANQSAQSVLSLLR